VAELGTGLRARERAAPVFLGAAPAASFFASEALDARLRGDGLTASDVSSAGVCADPGSF
jgi:hypothetical protein